MVRLQSVIFILCYKSVIFVLCWSSSSSLKRCCLCSEIRDRHTPPSFKQSLGFISQERFPNATVRTAARWV